MELGKFLLTQVYPNFRQVYIHFLLFLCMSRFLSELPELPDLNYLLDMVKMATLQTEKRYP